MSLKRFIDTSKPFVQMKGSASVMEAIDTMIKMKKGAILILDEATSVTGIFTERDIMTKIVANGRDPKQTQLGEVMTTDVIRLPANSSLDQAISIMGSNKIRHLPVVDNRDRIVGMISLRHLLHEKVEMVMEELNTLETYDTEVLGG